MNNTNNWLIAIVIVVLLGGGVWWIYDSQNSNHASSQGMDNGNVTDVNTTLTALLSEPVSADDWTIGPENAEIQLVAYEDYQCPACRSFAPIFESLPDQYPGQVSYTYRHFQLDGHPLALPAAQIAEAAGAQGKFWEMHDWLLSNDIDLDKAYEYAANDLGLDVDQMKADVEAGTHLQKIADHKQGGIASGVPGTPTVYMNGEMLEWEDTVNIEEVVKNKLGL